MHQTVGKLPFPLPTSLNISPCQDISKVTITDSIRFLICALFNQSFTLDVEIVSDVRPSWADLGNGQGLM